MTYYLKKFWKKNLAVILVQLAIYSLTASQALVQIQFFQGIVDLDLNRMLFWQAVNVIVWITFYFLQILCARARASATRAMNNQIRRDMAATLLNKSHQDYHAQDSGEYLSWFTSSVERIENSARNPFFDLAAYVCMAGTAIIALASVHWSLVLLSLVTTLILSMLPKLFTKKMNHLGEVCAQEQAVATGKLKELLGGFDVLCFFGRHNLFSKGIEQASDQIERPKFEQACKQEVISSGVLGNVSTFISLGSTLFVAVLSIKGIVIQSALTGTGNLCSSVSNGIRGIAGLRLSIASSKAYFDRISVHDNGAECQHNAGMLMYGKEATQP